MKKSDYNNRKITTTRKTPPYSQGVSPCEQVILSKRWSAIKIFAKIFGGC